MNKLTYNDTKLRRIAIFFAIVAVLGLIPSFVGLFIGFHLFTSLIEEMFIKRDGSVLPHTILAGSGLAMLFFGYYLGFSYFRAIKINAYNTIQLWQMTTLYNLILGICGSGFLIYIDVVNGAIAHAFWFIFLMSIAGMGCFLANDTKQNQ